MKLSYYQSEKVSEKEVASSGDFSTRDRHWGVGGENGTTTISSRSSCYFYFGLFPQQRVFELLSQATEK